MDKPYPGALEYYNKCKKERIFHTDTQELLEAYLQIIAEDGINIFCKIVRYDKKIRKLYEGDCTNVV